MKVLLVGRTGQLGSDLLALPGGRIEWAAPGRDELDVTSRDSVREALRRYRPDAVVNTAAFHDVPRCETEHGEAFRVNCAAVRDLALEAERCGALLVTFSTDYVFDGAKGSPYAEDDRPAPLQMYGLSKLAGEFYALSAHPRGAVVVRTCGLFGTAGSRSRGGNFVEKALAAAAGGGPLEVSCDQVVSPTFTGHLAASMEALLLAPGLSPGVYHLASAGSCTWHELAKAALEEAGLAAEVVPVDRGCRTGEMRRPAFSALACPRAGALGIALPPWREGVRDYFRRRPSLGSRA